MGVARSLSWFVGMLLSGAILLTAVVAGAASVGTGSLFENGERHVRFGAEETTLRNEARGADGRLAGRGSRFAGRGLRGEVAVPEPGAALLFGLGVLAVARVRRRA